MIIESRSRHIAKAITWRILALFAIVTIIFFTTGSFALAGAIGAIDTIIKMTLYYFHERAWNKSKFGKSIDTRKGAVFWLTGLSGSGKTTIADVVAERLRAMLVPVKRLDGDVARRTFSSRLGFSRKDRDENNRRAAHVASYLSEEHVVVASFISPYQKQRDYTRSMCTYFYEISIRTPIEVCEERDPKGIYKKVRAGEIKSFTGIHDDAPYEFPLKPDLVIETWCSVDECADQLINFMKEKGVI